MIHPIYPTYVNGPVALPVPRGPYVQENAKVSFLFLKAQRERLKAICDQFLNEPMGGDQAPYHYQPIIPYYLLSMADMIIYSDNEIDRNIGQLRELDLSFWILTAALKREGDSYKFDHLAWFMPYLYVNNAVAIATGREVFGFRKQVGVFELGDDFRQPDYGVQTLAFKELSPTTQGQMEKLLAVKPVEPQAASPTSMWGSWEETLREVALRFISDTPETFSPGGIIDDVINLLLHFVDVEQRIVFLKQFRNVEDSNTASFQAVVEGPARVTGFHGAGFTPGKYGVTIHKLASDPLVTDLGLEMAWNEANQSWSQEAEGFWIQSDFTVVEGKRMWQATPQPKKIAILGGGVGSITAAFALTDRPGWQNEYDITLYQKGWRLGGKGASGRQQAVADRIEEHGLHIWWGCYDNAFNYMRKCYDELQRPRGAPLGTFEDAFKPYNLVVLEDFHDGHWSPWALNMPTNNKKPGTGRSFTPWGYLQEIVRLMDEHFHKLPAAHAEADQMDEPEGWLDKFKDAIGDSAELVGLNLAGKLLKGAILLCNRLEPIEAHRTQHDILAEMLEKFQKTVARIVDDEAELSDELRRLWILFDLGVAHAIGLIVDGVILFGFDVIDKYDYREWLLRHGATEQAAYSAVIRGFYDGAFAYPGGKTGDDEPTRAGNISAGVAVHAAMLMAFDYKGSVYWRMEAGMGDTIFGPYYQLLRARGVKFKFFHDVKEIIPHDKEPVIEEMIIGEQATLKEGLTEYNPLFDVKGLPCWPSDPFYDQLEQGEQLKAEKINLESHWTTWQDVKTHTLKRGRDFDMVILGISIAGLKSICPKIIDRNPKWQAMVDNVQTVQTQAFQLWLKDSLAALGWPLSSPILDAYVQKFNTWGDMIQTLARENWPADHQPKNVAYFCGPMEDADPIPPPPDPNFPVREQDQVKEAAIAWLSKNIGLLWPNAVNGDGSFKWELLIDLDDNAPAGPERFESQYWRANIDPSERYVLSVAGTTQYRLKTDESGYDNLYLTGDWIKNGFDVGAVESATMSGLQCSRAISGYPQTIFGDDGI